MDCELSRRPLAVPARMGGVDLSLAAMGREEKVCKSPPAWAGWI